MLLFLKQNSHNFLCFYLTVFQFYLKIYKQLNLNFYVFEEEGMEIIKEQANNIYWIDFLKQSFKNDSIIPYFQPIVETQTGKIVKYECLARIKDREKIIPPFFFIDAAKKIGAITKITKIMIEKSCKCGLSVVHCLRYCF